ncbi:MAG TPA: redox-sensitive transcriptional activator SoxR [Actinomycetota bacterium]|nr:redox-sensitive transcriptional activator SoxR [Actinomycetota bacterium]
MKSRRWAPTAPAKDDVISIGEVAARSGHATSAIRFYEDEGLLVAGRTTAGHRTYRRHVLRRLAFIRSAQRVGLTLDEIRELLDVLPADRAPTKAQWGSLSRAMRRRLDARMGELEQLRETLTSCIGCGCLSLRSCPLSNPGDGAARRGAGARYWLGDDPDEVIAETAGAAQ